MRTTAQILLGILVVSLLVAGVASPVGAEGDPIIRLEGQSEMEIDLAMIVDDLVPVLLGLGEGKNGEWSGQLQQIMELIGIEALDRLHVKSTMSPQMANSQMTITLKPDVEGGFLAALAEVPSGRFEYGRYLNPNETVAVVSFQNFSEGMKQLVDLVAKAGLPIPGLVTDSEGSVSMWGLNFHRDLFPHLQGELDFILFPLDPGQDPEVPSMALVLGTPDGQGFRDAVIDIASETMGAEEVEEMRQAPGDKAGPFTFYQIYEEIFYGVSSGFIVVTTNVERVKSMIKRSGGGIRAPEGRQYMRLNGDLLLDFLADMAEAKGPDSDEERIKAEILRRVGEEPIGIFEVMTSSRPGRIEMEVRQPGNILSLEYRVFREFLAHAGAMQAAEAKTRGLQGIVADLDRVMTQYGVDHDGVFPEDLEVLVEQGYLETFPDLDPTPLGEYREGGYTYVPLRDDAGTVTGYFLFVYGGGKGSGFDVFTPENVTDMEDYQVNGDGKNDGVVGFCYDGSAVEQMERWRDDQ